MRDIDINNYLRSEIEKGSFPGFNYLIGEKDRILEYGYGGYKTLLPDKEEVDEYTIYDLASITKPLVTATIVLILHRQKVLDINDNIDKYLAQLMKLSNNKIKIRDLLSHCGGVIEWYPLFIYGNTLGEYIEAISRMALIYEPCKETRYSCIGYIILTAIIEKVTGKNIKGIYKEIIIDRLKLGDTYFHSDERLRDKTAATEAGSKYEMKMVENLGLEYKKWRDYLIRGEVHDSNSYFANSCTGNSGLFSNIYDLFKIGQIYYEDGNILDNKLLRYFYKNNTVFSDEHYSLGWKLSTSKDSVGGVISNHAIGHSGFTGTSIWVEPFNKKIYILLTNRIHPEVKNIDMNQIRGNFHKLAKEKYG